MILDSFHRFLFFAEFSHQFPYLLLRNHPETIAQIKREPCQVSEVTTSNNSHSTATIQNHFPILNRQQSHNSIDNEQSLLPIVKIEHRSPTEHTAIPSTTPIVMDHSNTHQMQSGAIPVGIAVARQRLQDHSQIQPTQTKDMTRFGGIGITNDLGEWFIVAFPSIN